MSAEIKNVMTDGTIDGDRVESGETGPRPVDPRLYKRKFTARTARFLLWERLALISPALARAYSFPTGARPMAELGLARQIVEEIELGSALGRLDRERAALLPRIGIDPNAVVTRRMRLFSLEDVRLLGHTGAVLLRDGTMAAPDRLNNLPKVAKPRRLTPREADPDRVSASLMTASPGRRHLFHFFFDRVLPLIAMIERLDGPHEWLDVYVNAGLTEFQRAFYAHAEKRWRGLRVIELAEDEALSARRLLVPQVTQWPLPFTWAPQPFYREIDMFASQLLGMDLSHGRRIFVSREDATSRRIENEAELAPILEAHGFERVVLSEMPYEAQLRAFAEAEAVVATHGAGLTHLFAARPGTKVLEMFVRETWTGDFAQATASYVFMARARGLAHRVWTCAQARDRKFNHIIDPAAFEAQLSALLTGAAQPSSPFA